MSFVRANTLGLNQSRSIPIFATFMTFFIVQSLNRELYVSLVLVVRDSMLVSIETCVNPLGISDFDDRSS